MNTNFHLVRVTSGSVTCPLRFCCAFLWLQKLIKIKNGRHRSSPHFFCCAKTQKPKFSNYCNFTLTFPTIWRCASDFFKFLVQFKMTAKDRLHNICEPKNTKLNLWWGCCRTLDLSFFSILLAAKGWRTM